METRDYWKDCISEAANECDLKLTPEQLDCLAAGAEGGHEHYGMAFYSPPWTDRMSAIELENKDKLESLQAKFDTYVRNSEEAVKQALHVYRDDRVSIGERGEVLRHGGRTERIQ